jgi:tetratricopeptide (TPR) repeat protein
MRSTLRVSSVRKGGFGTVYVVEDLENQNQWALKTFQSKYLWRDEDRERFMREALTWVSLDRHPNVVHARSVVIIEGFPCLWLEYVPLSLADVLRQLGSVPLAQAAKWALELCDGMFYVNQKLGLVHRDLKPSNCLASEDQTLKVTDFGLAKAFAEIQETSLDIGELSHGVRMQLTGVAGTPHYMAPEQFEPGAQLDTRTDIFAFGVLFYEMLTKDLPPVGEARSYIETHAPRNGVPDDFTEIILQCVQTDKRRRPNDFREVRSLLEVPYERFSGKAAAPPAGPIKMDAADWNDKGIALQKLGDYTGAVACYERAVWIDDQDPVLWLNYSSGLAKLKRFAEALDCLDRGLRLSPDDPLLWHGRAVALEELDRPEAAKSCYERALELRPADATLWTGFGAFLSKAGEPHYAIRCYEHAIDIDPRNVYAWTNRAIALFNCGSYEEALVACDEGLAVEPRSHRLWHIRSCALMELYRFQDALLACDRGLEIEPDYVKLWDNKGIALRELGYDEEAEKCFKRAHDSGAGGLD